jgi:hypothetical protein
MSQEKLHDLIVNLRTKRRGADIVDGEYNQRLDEIIESLEQQRLYPDSFDQYSSLNEQVNNLLHDYEAEHPTFKAILSSIQQLLNNFRI